MVSPPHTGPTGPTGPAGPVGPAGPAGPAGSSEQGSEDHLWDYVAVVLRHRRFALAIFLTATSVATIRTLLTRPVYQATAQILIDRENPNVLTFKDVTEVNSQRDDYLQTQYSLLQSRSLARRVVEALNLLQDPEFGGPRDPEEAKAAAKAAPGDSPLMEGAINGVLGRIRINPAKGSRLVGIGCEAFRPDLAMNIANKLSQLYITQTLEFRYQISSDAGEWLGGQVDQQRRKVEEGTQELQKLKEREGIVNIEERRVLVAQKLNQLGSSLTQARTDRLTKEALYHQMRNATSPEDLTEVLHDQVVSQLRMEQTMLENRQGQLLEKYLDQHPEVVKVRRQIEETKKRIASEAQRVIRSAENDYKAAAAQEATLAAAVEAAKGENEELGSRSGHYDAVKRDVDAARSVLNSLTARHKETDVAQELNVSNIRIVDPAVLPTAPIRPNRSRDVLTGVLLGLALAIGCAFFLEYLDNTVKTPDDVRTHLGAPLLGIVPETGKVAADLIVQKSNTQSVFNEAYRVVRTALNYSWPNIAPRILLVTSTAPGEGKTLTSTNLALTLASAEGKVLILDADLRRPQVHTLLRGKRTPGLSDVLVGKAKPSEAIQVLAGGLSLLPAGTTVPSPADLITGQAMRGFLEGLRGVYSWIVIDTPPVGAVAEPLILAPLADGVIVVVGAEMVPRKAVGTTLERIKESGARLLGVVLNRARIERHGYYYGRYYGHYYGHDYGHYGQRREGERANVASIAAKRRG
jgi:polysaccharide biosynthesis transport protein